MYFLSFPFIKLLGGTTQLGIYWFILLAYDPKIIHSIANIKGSIFHFIFLISAYQGTYLFQLSSEKNGFYILKNKDLVYCMFVPKIPKATWQSLIYLTLPFHQ